MRSKNAKYLVLFWRGFSLVILGYMIFAICSCAKQEVEPITWKDKVSQKTKVSIHEIDSCLQVAANRSDGPCFNASHLNSFLGAFGQQLTPVVPIASNYHQDLQFGLPNAKPDNWTRVGSTFWPNLPSFEKEKYSFDWSINGQYLFTGTSPLFDQFNIGCDSILVYTIRSTNVITRAQHERSFYAYQGWPGWSSCDCELLPGFEQCPGQTNVGQYFVPGFVEPHHYIVDYGWDLNQDYIINTTDLFEFLSRFCQ